MCSQRSFWKSKKIVLTYKREMRSKVDRVKFNEWNSTSETKSANFEMNLCVEISRSSSKLWKSARTCQLARSSLKWSKQLRWPKQLKMVGAAEMAKRAENSQSSMRLVATCKVQVVIWLMEDSAEKRCIFERDKLRESGEDLREAI